MPHLAAREGQPEAKDEQDSTRTGRTGFDSRLGRSRIFTRGDRAQAMQLVNGFSRGSLPPRLLHSGADPYSSRLTLIGSQDLDVKSRSSLSSGHGNEMKVTKRIRGFSGLNRQIRTITLVWRHNQRASTSESRDVLPENFRPLSELPQVAAGPHRANSTSHLRRIEQDHALFNRVISYDVIVSQWIAQQTSHRRSRPEASVSWVREYSLPPNSSNSVTERRRRLHEERHKETIDLGAALNNEVLRADKGEASDNSEIRFSPMSKNASQHERAVRTKSPFHATTTNWEAWLEPAFIQAHGVKVMVIGFRYGRWVIYTKMVVVYQDGGRLSRWWSSIKMVVAYQDGRSERRRSFSLSTIAHVSHQSCSHVPAHTQISQAVLQRAVAFLSWAALQLSHFDNTTDTLLDFVYIPVDPPNQSHSSLDRCSQSQILLPLVTSVTTRCSSGSSMLEVAQSPNQPTLREIGSETSRGYIVPIISHLTSQNVVLDGRAKQGERRRPVTRINTIAATPCALSTDCTPVQCFARRGDERVDAHVWVALNTPTLLGLRRKNSFNSAATLRAAQISSLAKTSLYDTEGRVLRKIESVAQTRKVAVANGACLAKRWYRLFTVKNSHYQPENEGSDAEQNGGLQKIAVPYVVTPPQYNGLGTQHNVGDTPIFQKRHRNRGPKQPVPIPDPKRIIGVEDFPALGLMLSLAPRTSQGCHPDRSRPSGQAADSIPRRPPLRVVTLVQAETHAGVARETEINEYVSLSEDCEASHAARKEAKSKYRNRIRLERASQKQPSDIRKTPCDGEKRCRERKINIKTSERVDPDTTESRNRIYFCRAVGAGIFSKRRSSDLAFHSLLLRFRRVGTLVSGSSGSCYPRIIGLHCFDHNFDATRVFTQVSENVEKKKRRSYKGYTGTRYKSATAATRRDLDGRAVF
ncbi:hypothetical protein PR048_008609 [Dryococelus australis]|uniref:Uncharacterized protein n=1 Tax=Dryococelus australis TaxID=614101 RepID=A0ABQ9HXP1_9NEOP|nr:hypothetical protein PR048_008609 [Dryococelus australis]